MNNEKNKKLRNKILVNLITSIRAAGTVALPSIYLATGTLGASISAVLFFLTDYLDGKLARKLHVESFFGSLLDSVSDKAFGIICLILLGTLNPIFLAIIGLELGIIAVNYKSYNRGNNIQSSKEGKAKTLLLAGAITGSLFCYSAPSIKELLHYINISTFDKLLSLNPDILSTILAIPVIGASLYVVRDYKNKAKQQDQKRDLESKKEQEIERRNRNIANINRKKELLEQQKNIIAQAKEMKSKKEIVHDLFDTDFYLEHKDDGIKKLLYK